ncbi:MAG: sel1 repeat family protein [Lachnospiraceae bacterium]|nr:sel1 repeat family protein [Lachnospiraceae bacterium]
MAIHRNQNRRGSLATVCAAALCLALLTSCGGKDTPSETGGAKSAASVAVSIPEVKKTDENAGEYTLFAMQVYGINVESKALEMESVLTLNEGGKGYMTINEDGGDVEKWEAKDGSIHIKSGVSLMEGTIEDGIITLDMGDGVIAFYAKEGADTSGIEVLSGEEYQAVMGEAVVELGIDYFYGLDEDGYDLEEAFACFEGAAEQGNGLAWYYLGRCYERMGEDNDRYKKAMEAYEKAAAADCAYGYIGIGDLYRKGRDVKQDEAAAMKNFESARKSGAVEGTFAIGMLYAYGQGVEKDAKKAAEYFETVAKESEDFGFRNEALIELGYLHCEEELGAASDPVKGIAYLQEAADAGHPHALLALGYIYDNGYGVKEDKTKALSYYAQAAEAGWPTAYYNMGLQYYYGDGVEPDVPKGVSCFETAAAMGYPDALLRLGDYYSDENGYRTEEDLKKAEEYYALAERFGAGLSDPEGDPGENVRPEGGEPFTFSTYNTAAVTGNVPEKGAIFTVEGDLFVESIMTYHWNNGKGAEPGYIVLTEDNIPIGQWDAEGSSGSGAENVNWTVYPNVMLHPGHTYEILDSGHDSWSNNAGSDSVGFFEIKGIRYESGGMAGDLWPELFEGLWSRDGEDGTAFIDFHEDGTFDAYEADGLLEANGIFKREDEGTGDIRVHMFYDDGITHFAEFQMYYSDGAGQIILEFEGNRYYMRR